MSADSEILREYLVSLGFKIDEPGQKKFDVGLGKLNLTAMGLGKTLIGVATAAQAMVAIFAVQMEKLYYSAKKSDSTVASMQALEFGAKNIGISGDLMKSSLEGMARAMRSNPGLAGLLASLGVEVKGRDKADVMLDLVTQLKNMPFAVAERYASMFGIDSDTLFLMEDGLDKMKESMALRKKMAAESGLDMDEAAKAAVVYANAMTEMTTRLDILYKMLSVKLMPSFLGFTQTINENLEALTKWLGKFKSVGEAWDSLMHPKAKAPGPAPASGEPAKPKKKKSFWEWATTSPLSHPKAKAPGPAPASGEPAKPKKKKSFWEWATTSPLSHPQDAPGPAQSAPASRRGVTPFHTEINAPAGSPAAPKSKAGTPDVTAKQAKLAALEVKYALPTGLLDALWAQESARGKKMLSKAGAKGDFQFMDNTAKEFNVDVNSFDSSAEGAAKKMKGLLRTYQGDLLTAVTAYNAGEGVMSKVLGGERQLKPESAAYGPSVLSRMPGGGIQQTNNITVNGSSAPADAARQVAQAMDQANADLVRNNKLRVR